MWQELAFAGWVQLWQNPITPQIRAEFDRYDRDADGQLSQEEVVGMLIDLGFEHPDADYTEKLIKVFGQFDVDNSGGIEINEFPKLWKVLGGESYRDEQERQVRDSMEAEEMPPSSSDGVARWARSHALRANPSSMRDVRHQRRLNG